MRTRRLCCRPGNRLWGENCLEAPQRQQRISRRLRRLLSSETGGRHGLRVKQAELAPRTGFTELHREVNSTSVPCEAE